MVRHFVVLYDIPFGQAAGKNTVDQLESMIDCWSKKLHDGVWIDGWRITKPKSPGHFRLNIHRLLHRLVHSHFEVFPYQKCWYKVVQGQDKSLPGGTARIYRNGTGM